MPSFSAEISEIKDVSKDGYTVSIKTRDGRGPLNAQIITSVFTEGRKDGERKGSGINVAPVKGSLGFFIVSSTGEYYLLGCVSPSDFIDFKGTRDKEIGQGHLSFSTPAGNAVEVYPSGQLEMKGTELSKINLAGQQIAQICNHFKVDTGVGRLNWLYDKDTLKGEMNWQVQSEPGDDAPGGGLSLGNIAGGEVARLSSLQSNASVGISRRGAITASADKEMTLSATGVVDITGRIINLNPGAGSGGIGGVPGVPGAGGIPGALKSPLKSLPGADILSKAVPEIGSKLPIPKLPKFKLPGGFPTSFSQAKDMLNLPDIPKLPLNPTQFVEKLNPLPKVTAAAGKQLDKIKKSVSNKLPKLPTA